jgi:hypothetical protein
MQVPVGRWPKDPKLKEMGMYHREHIIACVEPFSLALFTRFLGWSKERTQGIMADLEAEYRNRDSHFYTATHFVYGRKPFAKA